MCLIENWINQKPLWIIHIDTIVTRWESCNNRISKSLKHYKDFDEEDFFVPLVSKNRRDHLELYYSESLRHAFEVSLRIVHWKKLERRMLLQELALSKRNKLTSSNSTSEVNKLERNR